MKNFLIVSQFIVSFLVIILILLQKRGSALSSAFGGIGVSYFTRRGIEKKIFWVTCLLIVFFVVLSFLNLIL